MAPDQVPELRVGAGGQVGAVEEGEFAVRRAEIDAAGVDEVALASARRVPEPVSDRRDRAAGRLADAAQQQRHCEFVGSAERGSGSIPV
ncbi:hypothetical protein [Nocardia sp. NPDC048505]|uniref:hypothetical protein n=1 Tax=unclassified Nocardia TaxID=2637762 RepID=UPI0033E15CB0